MYRKAHIKMHLMLAPSIELGRNKTTLVDLNSYTSQLLVYYFVLVTITTIKDLTRESMSTTRGVCLIGACTSSA